MIYGNIFGTRAPAPGKVKRPYAAYGLAVQEKPLADITLERNDGTSFTIEHADLLDVVSSHDDFCSIIYDSCTLEFRGRYLGSLYELLKKYAITFAECFDPESHLPPPEGFPLIDRIRWQPILKSGDRIFPAKSYNPNIALVRMS